MGRLAAQDSEFRAYPYIDRVLSESGWNTANPAQKKEGEVYTQGEFRRHDPLLAKALGRTTPENIVLIPWDKHYRYWIVEAKARHNDLRKSLAQAKEYADKINAIEPGSARFVTGIAGTPDQSFYVTTCYWDGNEWQEVAINNYKTTGFLTPEQCREILDSNNHRILHYQVDLDNFLRKANAINKTLHENAVAARDRAAVVAGLLLALAEDPTIRIASAPMTLVGDVNTRVRNLLRKHNKEDFLPEVQLRLPNTNENHRKYWTAIVQTMQHLREMNIRSAINSGTDALGQFYETFLKYANDASEMGIVLTPRHITRFAVATLGVSPDDTIFDPACGTGGFLVAALDSIREDHYSINPDVYNAFRNDCLFGVEESDGVFGLALVNMIFRGDGKSHIHNGDCFDNRFYRISGNVQRLNHADRKPRKGLSPFTRVFMNPPFARDSAKESAFVDVALEQMQEGGLLFAILPNVPITGREEQVWRRELLKRHSVRAVIRMSDDLFRPQVNKGTYALIIEAHKPHRSSNKVFFGMLHDDNTASQKSKLISPVRAQDNVALIEKNLRRFLKSGGRGIRPVYKEIGISMLNMEGDFDFAPEAYLRDTEKNAINNARESTHNLFLALLENTRKPPPTRALPEETQQVSISDIGDVKRGNVPPIKTLLPGNTPVVTTTEEKNGIVGYFTVPDELIRSHCFTITANGGSGHASWHPYPFAASKDVFVCIPRPEYVENLAFCLYVCEAINHNKWRFDYYRKCTLQKLLRDVCIILPMKKGKVDFRYIAREVKNNPGYNEVVTLLGEI